MNKKNAPVKIRKILGVLCIIILIVLTAGTAYGLIAGTRQAKYTEELRNALLNDSNNILAYLSLGSVRVLAQADKKSIILATIDIPYPRQEKTFAEELRLKKRLLMQKAEHYLKGLDQTLLLPSAEGRIQAGLAATLNKELGLGKIDKIWFSNFAIVQ